MKFDSTKHLVGWYLSSAHKGGRLRQQRPGPQVQSGHIDNEATRLALAQALPRFAGTRERLDRWLRWADRTDGAVGLNRHDYDRLNALREWAEDHGYLTPRLTFPATERHQWTDLSETREKFKNRLSTRIQDRISLSRPFKGSTPEPNSES